MLRLWKALEILGLSLWLGGMFGFGVITAPVLFSTPGLSQTLAGTVAGKAIARVDLLGIGLGSLILVALVMAGRQRPARLWRLAPVLVMIGLAAANLTYVRGRMAAIREQVGRPLEEVAATDPLRAEYDRWHRISVNLWLANAAVGTATLLWAGLENEGAGGGRGEPLVLRPRIR
ncbi:MAG: DUF4149 domain-containing protein [Bacillota bacterium]|nr:MAG: hypothetical protein DIU70_08385 [Bacillota bacterium]